MEIRIPDAPSRRRVAKGAARSQRYYYLPLRVRNESWRVLEKDVKDKPLRSERLEGVHDAVEAVCVGEYV
jgi:hypothetical protein